MTTNIIGFAGSLRRQSFNAALLRAAAALMPEGSYLEIASIADFPLYDADIEHGPGIPAAVTQLKDRIAASSGLLIATPEYNNSIPGVAKNAIDWLSRPDADIKRVFGNRPVAVMGGSPGGFGTTLAQTAWLPVFRTLRVRPYWDGRLMVSRVHTLFDQAGELTDDKTREHLRNFVHGFVRFATAAH
jgi:chromate reductase, NAD(P)H dehydrogenase (quinone)